MKKILNALLDYWDAVGVFLGAAMTIYGFIDSLINWGLLYVLKGSEIKLTDSPGNPFGDYMLISSNGYLHFYDSQGLIYSVPPLK